MNNRVAPTNRNLKNYTTKIDTYQTVAEIEQILAKHRAKQIMKEYDSGEISALFFSMDTPHGLINFKLPVDTSKVLQLIKQLKNQGQLKKLPKRNINQKHASRVAWRIMKDWIDAQLEMIRIDLVQLEQIFLPYAFDPKTNLTLFDKLRADNYKLLLGGTN